jgi:hypothetical protein
MYDVIDGLCRGLISPAELFTHRFWQCRKALRILMHARFHLSFKPDRTDWEAIALLIDKAWTIEDEY